MPLPKDPKFIEGYLKRLSEAHKGKPAWNKGLTKETDERVRKQGEKVSKSKKGKKRSPFSEEWKKNMSEAGKGHISWNKGLTKKTDERVKRMSESKKGKKMPPRTEKHRKNLSEAMRGEKNPMFGKNFSEEHRRNLSKAGKGKKKPPFSEEHRKNLSETHKGEKSCLWRGGISSINDTIRKGIEFRLWREAVFARDNWVCQKCKKRSGETLIYLHPHHIQNFADYPELRTSIENGITFCKDCHREFHKRYGYRNNTMEQIEEFLRGYLTNQGIVLY